MERKGTRRMADEQLAPVATTFWTNDEGWQVAWPAALGLAVVVHAFAFMGAANSPPKKVEPTIQMAIAMPPPPEPPPEPEKPKPKPKPKVLPPELPPPPNETAPPETPPTEVQPVTGVTADSVVGESASGMSVRVGNTTFGNPDDEPFVTPKDVQQITGPAFDLSAYRKTVFDILNHEKRYPRKAKVLQLQGRCVVNLALNRDGSLAEPPKLLGKGTGHAVLDEECLRMAKAVRYPAIVGEVTELPVRVRQPIEFTILDP